MNVLILVITITWSFGISAHPVPSQKIIVGSPEEAAIYIYNDRPLPYQVEPDQKKYTLYEIDLEKKTIKEIPIPELSFKAQGKPR
jgi:hypothetical protein